MVRVFLQKDQLAVWVAAWKMDRVLGLGLGLLRSQAEVSGNS